MRHAKDRILATPKSHSTCPCCNTPVVSKCGKIKVWHWAHESKYECDTWYEGISAWHLSWQDLVKEEFREIVIGPHRADIKLSSGKVVEIQNSPIDLDVVEEREVFYGNMVWIFNAEKFAKNFKETRRNEDCATGDYFIGYRWKRPKQSILSCTAPVFLDFGKEVLQVKSFKSYENEGEHGPYTTWYVYGFMHTKDRVLFHNVLFGDDYLEQAPPDILPKPS